MKSAVTVFLKPLLLCTLCVILGCLVGMYFARTGRIRLELRLPPIFAAGGRLRGQRRIAAWLCCFLRVPTMSLVSHRSHSNNSCCSRVSNRSRSRLHVWGTLGASVGWGAFLGLLIITGLLVAVPDASLHSVAGQPLHGDAGLPALALFMAIVSLGGFIGGACVGHIAPLRGICGITVGLLLGGSALLLGRPELHAKQMPTPPDRALTVERGPVLSRVTWRPRGLQTPFPVAHTLTLVHGAAPSTAPWDSTGGKADAAGDTDEIFLDHNVVSRRNTEVVFRMHADESSGGRSSPTCTWHEHGGRRRVVVDNGLEAQLHEIDPWALLPRNHFATVGFASISGGHRRAADLPKAVAATSGRLPPPPQCLRKYRSSSDYEWNQDDDRPLECGMTLHTQQAVGVASVAPGTLDVVLHRRLMQSDEKGITEPLDDGSAAHVHTKLELFEQPGFDPPAVAAGDAACSACMLAAQRRRATLQFSQGLTVVAPPSSSAWAQCASAWFNSNTGGGNGNTFHGLEFFEVLSVQMTSRTAAAHPRFEVLLQLLEPPGCTPTSALQLQITAAETALAGVIGQCVRAATGTATLPAVVARVV